MEGPPTHTMYPTGLFASVALLFTPAPLAAQETAAAPAVERVRLELTGEGSLEVAAAWEPFADSVYKLHETYPQLQGFTPAARKATHGMEAFRPFLPADAVAVGDVWRVNAAATLPFLRQFHAGATVAMHHGYGSAPGAWACLRAIGPDLAEVSLRIHAEFVLEKGRDSETTSTLTPAQFAGRLLLDRQSGMVRSFHLFLPPRNGNVDVNIPYGGPHAGIIADIGYIPRMELVGGADVADTAARSPFDSEISEQEARARLARKFYSFAEIRWLDLTAALHEACDRQRPLHVVILFGCLDDESC